MNTVVAKKKRVREKRAMRVRKRLHGSSLRPRLSVFKSLKHIGAQLIDDEKGVTILSYSTLAKEAKGKVVKSKEGARLIGEEIGRRAKEQGVQCMVFDRGRFKYHGLIALLVDGVRREGIEL